LSPDQSYSACNARPVHTDVPKRDERHCSKKWAACSGGNVGAVTGMNARHSARVDVMLVAAFVRVNSRRKNKCLYCLCGGIRKNPNYCIYTSGRCSTSVTGINQSAVSIESLKNPRKVWGNFESQFKEFEQINLSAWWNYQRDRVSVRSNKRPKPKSPQSRHPHLGPRSNIPQNKTIIYPS
jgi:hypothetical protein